jgi:hypothetical protein
MPIQHTVIFRLIHDPGSENAESFIADARAALTAIPGVEAFTVQRQVSPKSTLSWQFSMVFADDTAYTAYNEHPAHVALVRERWSTEVAEFQEYDFVPF